MSPRWAAAIVLLALPACFGRAWYRPPPPPPRPQENDSLGALPVFHRAPPQQEAAPRIQVVTRADEFTGRTSHELEIGIQDAGTIDDQPVRGSPHDAFTIVGIPGAAEALVTFHTGAPSWQYLRCHHVDALADGIRLALSEADHDGRVLHGGVSEHVSFTVPLETLDAIAAAGRTRFRVCRTIFTLPPHSAEAVAELLRRIRALPVAEAPAEPPASEKSTRPIAFSVSP